MRQHRYGAQETGTAATLGDEKAQKHPKCRRAALGDCPAGSAALLQHKLAQAPGI